MGMNVEFMIYIAYWLWLIGELFAIWMIRTGLKYFKRKSYQKRQEKEFIEVLMEDIEQREEYWDKHGKIFE